MTATPTREEPDADTQDHNAEHHLPQASRAADQAARPAQDSPDAEAQALKRGAGGRFHTTPPQNNRALDYFPPRSQEGR